jgi:hypothetical protein
MCSMSRPKGLKTNLLSINQICDDDLVVQFSKKECNIFNSKGEWIMGGLRTIDNCYRVEPSTTWSCNKTKLDEVELWHKRLGHLNF